MTATVTDPTGCPQPPEEVGDERVGRASPKPKRRATVAAGSDDDGADEVDAGVGGRAAVEVGRRLGRLARTHQVIVVTHLPQVAAFADTHLVVDKTGAKKGAANSGVRTLSSSERVVELARMLAGLDDTETGRAHAEELLATAHADRAAL